MKHRKRVVVLLKPAQHERLKRVIARIDDTMSSYARRALLDRLQADTKKECA